MKSGSIGWQLIRGDNLWQTVLSHCLYEELLSRSFVTPFSDKTFQHFTFMIDCTPKVKSLAVNFDKDFIQVPLPI